MIDIKSSFKKCCGECANIDLDIETDEIIDINGNKNTYVNIGCTHTEVCRMYNEKE